MLDDDGDDDRDRREENEGYKVHGMVVSVLIIGKKIIYAPKRVFRSIRVLRGETFDFAAPPLRDGTEEN
jgi:hypothetical protein